MSTFTRNPTSGKYQVDAPSDTPSVDLNANFAYAPVIDARDFGVICDGVTDNRNAMNTAIQAAAGGTVYFPVQSFDYLINAEQATIKIPSSTKLLFQRGAAIKLINKNGLANNILFTNTTIPSDPDYVGTDHDITIDGLYIYSPIGANSIQNHGGYPAWTGVLLNNKAWLGFVGVQRLRLNNIRFKDTTGYAVYIARASDVECDGWQFSNHTGDGIHFGGYVYRSVIRNIFSTGTDGVIQLTAYDWIGYGLSDGPIEDVLIENVVSSGDTSTNILLEPGTTTVSMTGTPNLAATASTNLFTRATGSFLTDGFRAGLSITTAGFSNGANNGTFTITAATATTLAVSSALVTEASNSGRTLVGTSHADMRNITIRKTRNQAVWITATPDPHGGGDHVAATGIITNVKIEDMVCDALPYSIAMITAGNTGGAITVNGLSIDGLAFVSTNASAIVQLGNASIINNFVIRNLNERPGTTSPPLIIGTGSINGFLIDGGRIDRTGVGVNDWTGLTGMIDGLTVRNVKFLGAWPSKTFVTAAGQTIKNLLIQGCTGVGGNTGATHLIEYDGGLISYATIRDCNFDSIQSALWTTDGTNPVTLILDGSIFTNCRGLVTELNAGVVIINANNCYFGMRQELTRAVGAGTSNTWQSSGCKYVYTGEDGGSGAPNLPASGGVDRVINSTDIEWDTTALTCSVGDMVRASSDHKVKMCTTAPATFTAVA